jgi:FMN-dependent NADH-azoreductase
LFADMKSLLLINSSGRSARSVTRSLTSRLAADWSARHPDGEVILRDIGLNPVPPINESWIAAAFTAPGERTAAMHEALAASEGLIDEIFRATAIVVGVPMYNFGMPAQFKAYVDQIVRVGRTFSYGDGTTAELYQPLVPSRPVLIVTSTGASGYEPGGHLSQFNFLDPHLGAIFNFIGLTDMTFVRVINEEQKDERFQQAMADAELAIKTFLNRISTESNVA